MIWYIREVIYHREDCVPWYIWGKLRYISGKNNFRHVLVLVWLRFFLFYLHFILLQKQLFFLITGLQSQNTSKDSEQPWTLKYRVVLSVFNSQLWNMIQLKHSTPQTSVLPIQCAGCITIWDVFVQFLQTTV